MANYTHTTFATLKTQLANRLGDAGGAFWTDAELGLYIQEALRTWGLLTGYWRDEGTLTPAGGVPIFDITSIQNGSGGLPLSQTVLTSDIVNTIEYHLLEPSSGTSSSWVGSEQFTIQDLSDALLNRRNRFLLETGCNLTWTTAISGVGSPMTKIVLDDRTIEVRRLVHVRTSDGLVTPLQPVDVAGQRNYSSSMIGTAGTPFTYSYVVSTPLELFFAPPVSTLTYTGTFQTIAIFAVPSFVIGNGAVMAGIPDDMTWAIKWGAMADLLGRDGPAQDLSRAYFCERRYQLGVELSRDRATVINAYISGIPLNLDSLTNLDNFNPQWQSAPSGAPTTVATARNLIGLYPPPANGTYVVTLDVVAKAVIPSVNGDFIQVGREILEPLLDYAQHLAAFKEGGMEFQSSFRGAQNFFDTALYYNETLAANNAAAVALMRQSLRDEDDRPLHAPGGIGGLQKSMSIPKRMSQIIASDQAGDN